MHLIKRHLGPVLAVLTVGAIVAVAAREGLNDQHLCEAKTANPALCELAFDAGYPAAEAIRMGNER